MHWSRPTSSTERNKPFPYLPFARRRRGSGLLTCCTSVGIRARLQPGAQELNLGFRLIAPKGRKKTPAGLAALVQRSVSALRSFALPQRPEAATEAASRNRVVTTDFSSSSELPVCMTRQCTFGPSGSRRCYPPLTSFPALPHRHPMRTNLRWPPLRMSTIVQL